VDATVPAEWFSREETVGVVRWVADYQPERCSLSATS